eukprot:7980221-Alexandrium_andersonii.AAC.1
MGGAAQQRRWGGVEGTGTTARLATAAAAVPAARAQLGQQRPQGLGPGRRWPRLGQSAAVAA